MDAVTRNHQQMTIVWTGGLQETFRTRSP